MNINEVYTNLQHSIDYITDTSNKTKNICLMWSGGCDSTAVLFAALKELKEKNDTRKINTFSFYHDQLHSVKMAKEEEARMKFLIHIKEIGYYENYGVHQQIFIPKLEIFIGNGSTGFVCCQPALWISHIIPVLLNNSILLSGYIDGDCFFTFDAFSNWYKVFDGMTTMLGKSILFMAPMYSYNKKNILEFLINYKIYDYTWHCEAPTNEGRECGWCPPCKKHTLYKKLIELEQNAVIEAPKCVEVTDLGWKKAESYAKTIEQKPLPPPTLPILPAIPDRSIPPT